MHQPQEEAVERKELVQYPSSGTFLVVQWLRLRTSNAGDEGLIPGQGTEIPHAAPASSSKKKKKNPYFQKVESVNGSVMSDSLWSPDLSSVQAPLSMGFPRQEYWSGLPFPSPGNLSNPGIKLGSLAWQADSLPSEPHPFHMLVWSTRSPCYTKLVSALPVNQRFSWFLPWIWSFAITFHRTQETLKFSTLL